MERQESSVFYSVYPENRIRPPSKLMQSLFELCVVVGMDEDTGLIPLSRSRKGSTVSTTSSDEDSIFNKEYESSILAVISGQFVSFPETREPINGEPYYIQDHIACNTQITLSPSSKKSGKLRFAKPVELPLGSDVIFSLPQFCLPEGAWVYESKPDDNIHTLVLTDIEGRRSYCSCLTFYKPYYVTEDVEIRGNFLLSVEETKESNGQSQICYVPTCCCLISKFPYFQIAKDCLSSFLPELNKNGKEMRQSLMQLICNLCQVPIPPPGPISIEFELCNMKHLVRSAGEPKKRIIDMAYHLPFLCFSVDDILLLLSCILTQQRIIFLASDISLLAPITEALLSYIQPLLWGLTYVPVLPSNLIDLLEAPGSFIMGCDSKHTIQVKSLLAAQDEDSSIVCASIDNGEVEIGESSIPLIPEPYRDEFRERIKKIKFHYDLAEVASVSEFDAAEFRKRRRDFNNECANRILEVCFELMLNLFREFTHFIKGGGSDKGQQVLFDRVGFVDCKPEKDREFFRQLCASHAFSTYLCERYEKDEVDFFSNAISENVTPVGHRKRSITSLEFRHSRSSVSLSNGKLNLFCDEVFKLTPFVQEGLHTGRFYQNCIRDLNLLVQSSDSKSSSIKACYLYLRGMMYVANGEIYEGLDDFFALSSKSVQIFPTNSTVEILSQFDVPSMEKLKHKSYFRKMDLLLRKHKKVSGSVKVKKQLIFDGVPRYPVGKDEFIERVMLCQITESNRTAERLFKVLVLETGEKTIDPGTFSDLYATLNQADTEAHSVAIQGVTLGEQEFVIKVSSLCLTSSGVGRLLLTNIRLLFMAHGNSSCKQFTKLLDIASIEKYQHYVLIPPGVPALRVINKEKNQKPLFVCLKGQREMWYSYLQEMVVCHERAETLRDPQFVSLGSQNVMLADALIKSGLSRHTALAMCYFTKTNEPVKEISGDTEKLLLQRLNPSEKDTAITTVEALVYVPKLNQGDIVYPEQIWCGMGSGSIVIFKRAIGSETWNFETQMSCANDRVSCLLAVGSSRVWAGSLDATIYVFDRCTYKANQHLEEHSDIISAMILQQKDGQSIIWSASLNGQIIGWDAEALIPKKKIKLKHPSRTFVSFLLIGKYFWCDIKSAIMLVDSTGEGDIENKLEVKDGKKVLSVDCMISVSSEQVWCCCGKQGRIAIFNTKTLAYSLLPIQTKETNIALTKMALTGNEVWIGSRKGLIYALPLMKEKSIEKAEEVKVKKTLKIHDDSVRSMCVISGGYVATGPGSRDGKIAIWRYEEETEQDRGFEMFSGEEIRCAHKEQRKYQDGKRLDFLTLMK